MIVDSIRRGIGGGGMDRVRLWWFLNRELATRQFHTSMLFSNYLLKVTQPSSKPPGILYVLQTILLLRYISCNWKVVCRNRFARPSIN